ncbi:MAG TPA: aldehyde ferredoxin oxidoreductase N-terminal domain-containing protein, partial [Desulfotignum sp.]|nr:aldehyde ferredoxin oxidoreductase N-terminal domain-containing protein [Desulfotignum sp.]
MNNACAGRFLCIDLTQKEITTLPVSGALRNRFIGGKGFGARLLADQVPPGTDPLSAQNRLMFMTGPLTGTAAPA